MTQHVLEKTAKKRESETKHQKIQQKQSPGTNTREAGY